MLLEQDEEMFPRAERDFTDTTIETPRTAPSSQHGDTGMPSTTVSDPSASSRTRTHQPSGYTWERDDDAPGFLWKNRKARDECAKVMEAVVDLDHVIGRRFAHDTTRNWSQSQFRVPTLFRRVLNRLIGRYGDIGLDEFKDK